MTKMNEQTIFVTLPGSSTLEFQTIENVPVYEPANRYWTDYVVHESTITTISEDGYVERWNVDTGRMDRWFVRPTLQNVVTLDNDGHYFEFAKDGSIRSSCAQGTYYWGPVNEMESEPCISKGTLGSRHVSTLDEIRDQLADIYHRATDPMVVLGDEIDSWWNRQFDKRTRRSAPIDEEIEKDETNLAFLKKCLATNPKIYTNETIRTAYEARIKQLEYLVTCATRIAAPKDRCPECKREGVCMCYT